jgi:site-specific DNA-methyltransferase (adenine-specific)
MAKVGRRSTHPDENTRWRINKRAQRQRQRAQVLQVPCVQIGDCTLYQGDARVIAAGLQHIDALVTDPPYGTNYDFTKVRRSRTPLQLCSTSARWTTNMIGDDQPFDPTPWLSYPQVILWGANHYASRLPDSPAWLTWYKRCGKTPDDFADCEHAWTNLRGVNRLHEHLWRGYVRAGEENLVHGELLCRGQKPVSLMLWCVEKTTGRVLDPYMGSGTTGLACLRLGRPFVGIEIDPAIFAIACDRLAAACRQLHLFAPAAEAAD